MVSGFFLEHGQYTPFLFVFLQGFYRSAPPILFEIALKRIDSLSFGHWRDKDRGNSDRERVGAVKMFTAPLIGMGFEMKVILKSDDDGSVRLYSDGMRTRTWTWDYTCKYTHICKVNASKGNLNLSNKNLSSISISTYFWLQLTILHDFQKGNLENE